MHLQVYGTVNIYIVRDGKVLLGRRQNTEWMNGYLCPPGGRMQPDETPRQAAVRELEEEVGLKLAVDDLQFACVADRSSDVHSVAYEFVIDGHGLKPVNAEPSLCSELVWADMHDLPEDLIADFRDIINRSLLGKETYLELRGD